MNDRKPKEKKDDKTRSSDFERSLEVNYMLLLMRKYPEKAKEAVKRLQLMPNTQ